MIFSGVEGKEVGARRGAPYRHGAAGFVETSSAKVILVTDQHPLSGVGVYTTRLYELMRAAFPEIELRNLHYFRFPETPPHQAVPGQAYARSRFGAVRARGHNERALARQLDGSKDLVHLCGASYDLAVRIDRPLATVHDFGLRTWRAFLSSRPELVLVEGYSVVDWLRTPRFLKRCRQIVSVSEYTRSRLRAWTGLDSVAIPHWMDQQRFRPRPSVESRALLDLPVDRRIVLCVGSGAAYKNHALLRRVAAALPPEYLLLKVGFPLAGSPAQVRNEGVVSPDLYAFYFDAADAYLHLSFREGFGIPLLEALASGTPVVALANPPAPEVLGEAAQWLPSGAGAHDVLDALRTVVEAPERAAQLRAVGQARLPAFDPARIRARYTDLYLNALRA
jgi:glycosyltransferase involved in cell wall biosynthesis